MRELELWSITQFRESLRQSEKNFVSRETLARTAKNNGQQYIAFTRRAFGFTVGLLMLVLILSVAALAQSSFRVEGAGAEASPRDYVGPCPGVIKFTGKIQANGKGTVKYTWLRSDGATAPVEYLDFEEAGVKYVSTTWTLGDARVLPGYSGWQQIKVLSPNEYLSNKAEFKLTCEQPPTEQQCDAQSQMISWAGKVLGGDGNAIYALAAPDAQTITLGSMQLGGFGGGRAYPGLAALLGVSDAALAKADVIAFELNGGGAGESGGFESSRWFFSDGTNPPQFIDFDATRDWRTIPGVIQTGTISGSSPREVSGRNYSRFFGVAPEIDVYVSYILFDLTPAINTASPSFSVKVSSFAKAGEGSPDVDAVGVLNCGTKSLVGKK